MLRKLQAQITLTKVFLNIVWAILFFCLTITSALADMSAL